MSLPDRHNPYRFDEFLAWRQNVDYYRDDPFLRKVVRHFTGPQGETADAAALALSRKASFRWRDLAEEIARPEKRPFLLHYDGHHHRIDRIVRPREAEILEREVFAEALFSRNTSPWVKLIKMYLIYQNGEAGTACPVTCTEGLVLLLERFADTPETKRILAHCREGIAGAFGIGAQYVSEIQGGSDIPANRLEAVREGKTWRLFGSKFFCSAAHADYAVVTAKPAGSQDVALFVMPSWLEGDKEREVRNGFTIDRLKGKLGTVELPTGELTFHGAIAYPVGPLAQGLANVVGIVLTRARLTVGLSAAAFMTRAVREAVQYAAFREAFGRPIGRFPLLTGQLAGLDRAAKRTTAGAFRLYRDLLSLEDPGEGPPAAGTTEEGGEAAARKRRFELRELIMLQKIAASRDCTAVIHEALSVFGGHGVIEDFSSLPRLYRDAAINELWEGPRNVLLTQIHRDLQQAAPWYGPEAFVGRILAGRDRALIGKLSGELAEFIAHPDLLAPDEKTIALCRRWDLFCHDLFHAYQEGALREAEGG
jgi:alkylation response protein AidB-like acyl-CoA dehydrogenase